MDPTPAPDTPTDLPTEPSTTEPSTAETVRRIRERRERLRHAEDQLASAAGAPFPGRTDLWWAGVGHAASELVTTFAEHVAETEGESGLFVEVEEVAPRLSRQVDRLRAEHVEVAALLDRLARTATPTDAEQVTAARELILDVLSRLARHRFSGSDLLYETYHVDIGAAD